MVVRKRRRAAVVAESTPAYSPRRLLLDTHTWIWWYANDHRLGKEAKTLIKHASDVRFSVASAWEIAIKRSTGGLVLPVDIDLARELETDGMILLSISLRHAEAVRTLPRIHRDPFDRMLVAQAQVEGLSIVTADTTIAKYGATVVDARR